MDEISMHFQVRIQIELAIEIFQEDGMQITTYYMKFMRYMGHHNPIDRFA